MIRLAIFAATMIVILLVLGESPGAIGRSVARTALYATVRHTVYSVLNHHRL